MNKLFKFILENYNDGSEKVDSSTELYKALTKTLPNKIGYTLGWYNINSRRFEYDEDSL